VIRSQGLYAPENEHDACGVGFLANIDGKKEHSIIEKGIQVLKNLVHRGATGADPETGDGAGLLFQMPDKFFRKHQAELTFELPASGEYGVGVFFMPRTEVVRAQAISFVEKSILENGLELLGWRDVPVDESVLGRTAALERPFVMQAFVKSDLDEEDFERKLYVIRKCIEKSEVIVPEDELFYTVSFSCRTIIYKGLLLPKQVALYYLDLNDEDMESSLVVVHQRYSTNTFPSWPLAQPFRYLAHNGEINTLRGNRNWMRSRERNFQPGIFGEDDIKKIVPVLEDGTSDSAQLDNALELLVNGGRGVHHAMAMLIPQAWGVKYPMGPDMRGFYEYHAGLMEPWDGPAAVVFSDGHNIGALLDRNGLRPGRFTITKDGFIAFGSEVGILEFEPEEISETGALRPGQMLFVDAKEKRVLHDYEMKMQLSRKQPYRRWVEENKIAIHGFFNALNDLNPDESTLLKRGRLFGYSREDLRVILDVMASDGKEPVGSMGADQALAVLSEKPQLLYWYFKQVFAQVTNPPIDSIREELVMSLMTFLGSTDDILTEKPQHARLVKMKHPILSNDDLTRLCSLEYEKFTSAKIQMGFPAGGDGKALKAALDDLCQKARDAAVKGAYIVVLSDKNLPEGLAPIPALLAVSAVNQYLVKERCRTRCGLIVETGEAREVMHMALLLGYGASAINPYLAFEFIADMADNNDLTAGYTETKAMENYVKALCKGLLKTMSKIGISTLRSYRSAQIFQAIGLNSSVVDAYFPGTPSPIEGIGLDEIAIEANERYFAAYTPAADANNILPGGGQYSFKADGERHLWTPETISYLQWATRQNDTDIYRKYAKLINDQTEKQSTLRGLFSFKKRESVPLDEVEPVENIMKRFVTGAMSFGSISREAHETLAIAMNRIGGMSNSGEGGEDPARFIPDANGDSRCSAIKQIASGRFGVTAEYLASGRDLQIKIAQGAKPGEGGQLPGYKVNKEIAEVRNSTPGVTLISPPPHHDIYSIEDIAQLIYDLKNANPEARVSVKLVSEVGVGTVAAGVVKGHADMVLIAGYDGGTGASPLSSIKHAGGPWEIGLAETQQTLVLNGLRNRTRLQCDGQLKTGRDVFIAGLLGAEEFGFATTALVVCGCVMMRKCHKNTCPVGVATQDPELRKRYTGKPEYVINFLRMISEELRELMAENGFRNFNEVVGRSDVLEVNKAVSFYKAKGLDFTKLFYRPDVAADQFYCNKTQDHGIDKALDQEILSKVKDAIDNVKPIELEMKIRNIHRTVGTITSNYIAKKYGHKGLPDDTITLKFNGYAGQSFGAFASKGMTLIMEGEVNDYLGKGLSGAKIIVKPKAGATFDSAKNIIAGNVMFYGATSGEAYINGRVGERFCIRNSGVKVVVEGVGDHACEYMTGGRAVILGETGVNFAAGMSGGIAYVYDELGNFDNFCNLEMVDLELVKTDADKEELHTMIENHIKYTGSPKAISILENWKNELSRFIKVFPTEYKRVLGEMMKEDEEVNRDMLENN